MEIQNQRAVFNDPWHVEVLLISEGMHVQPHHQFNHTNVF